MPPENEIRINKLFVTLTRAIHGVYFIDQVQDFATKINELLNLNLAHHAEETPPVKNELDTRKQWEKLAEHHLKKGEHEIAHSILSSYLNQSGQMMPEQLNPVPAQQLSNKKARYLQKDNKKTLDNKKIELNSPQSPAPAKPKRTPKQYCQDLVEGITVNNLNNLFMNPHLVSLLFEYPVKNGDILFIHLKNSKFKKEFNLLFLLYKKEILNALSLERLAKPINSEHKEPLFFHLCRTFEGITILENLPNIIYTTFPYEILFYKMPIQSDFHPNTTPFFWLSISTLGQGLLHKILKLNPKLVSRITPQDLAGHTITYKNITLYLSSVNFLSHSLCGHQIIKILLENKKLAEENHLHLSTKAIKPLHTITTSFSAVSLRNYLQQLEQIFSLMAYEDLAIIHLANPEGLNLSLSYIPSETNRWHLLVLNDYPPKFLPCVGTALIDDIYEGFSRTCSDSDKFILNSTICLSSNALSRNKIQKGLKKIRIKMNELKAEEICPLMATYDDIEGIKNYFNKMNHATKKLCLEKAVINNSKQVFFELFSHAVQAALELDFVEQLLQFTLMPDAKEIFSALINTPCLKDSRFNFTEFAFKAIRIGSNKIFKKLMEQKTLPINAILNENTMATLACLYGREKILDLLMLNGINLNAGAADGRSPLHIAAQEGYVDIVKRLIQAQADINSLGVENVTPLFLAACNGHIEVVELLLRCGADISKPRLFTVKSLRDFLKLKKIDYPIEAKGDDQILTITPRKIARLLRLDSIVTLIDQYKPKKNIRLIAAQEISEEESMNKGITNSTAIKK